MPLTAVKSECYDLGPPADGADDGFQKEMSDMRLSFEPLTFYQKFEHVCVMVLTALIAIIIVLALWNLTLKSFSAYWRPISTQPIMLCSRRCSA